MKTKSIIIAIRFSKKDKDKTLKRIICLFIGHKVVFGLFEGEKFITNKGCNHCGISFRTLLTCYKFWRGHPMPGATAEEWNAACDKYEEEARKEFYFFGRIWKGADTKYL